MKSIFSVVAVMWSLASVATAAPAKQACVGSPDAKDWPLRASVSNGGVDMCLNEPSDNPTRHSCFRLELASGAFSKIPPLPPVSSEYREPAHALALHDGKPSACSAQGACRAAGKQLQRALAAVQKDDSMVMVSTSDDGALVAFKDQVWNVASDRRLALALPVPRDFRNTAGFSFLDNGLILGSWTPCAGPCTMQRLFRRDGKILIDKFSAYNDVIALPGARFALFRSGADPEVASPGGVDRLEVHDIKTAKLVRVVPFAGYVHQSNDDAGFVVRSPIVALPDGALAIANGDDQGIELVAIELERGTVVRRHRAPFCPK